MSVVDSFLFFFFEMFDELMENLKKKTIAKDVISDWVDFTKQKTIIKKSKQQQKQLSGGK